ncbi:Outer membrane protein beta-barrel domain-containing protein [bacterium A37T11]|nr:Outer membrane protein beta-barrel domain-containing protein [bacterium A37T11]
MKQVTLLCIGLLFAGFLQAQVSIGVRGGLSIPNLTSAGKDETPLSKGYSSTVGPGFAIFADFKISNLFSIEPAVEYSAQGGKKDGISAIPTAEITSQIPAELLPTIEAALGGNIPKYIYADYKAKAKFNYLMVPVLAKFGWDLHQDSPWRVYGGVGPFIGFLLNAKSTTTGNNEPNNTVYLDEAGTQTLPDFIGGSANPLALPLNKETDIKDDLHKINVGFEAKVGFNYKLKRSNIFIEGGGNYGFIKIQKDAENGKNNTGAGIVMVGYSYTL